MTEQPLRNGSLRSVLIGPGGQVEPCPGWDAPGRREEVSRLAREMEEEDRRREALKPEVPEGYHFSLVRPVGFPIDIGRLYGPDGSPVKSYPGYDESLRETVRIEAREHSERGPDVADDLDAILDDADSEMRRQRETPDVPAGYSFFVARPRGREPVGILCGPEMFERRYPGYDAEHKGGVERDAAEHNAELERRLAPDLPEGYGFEFVRPKRGLPFGLLTGPSGPTRKYLGYHSGMRPRVEADADALHRTGRAPEAQGRGGPGITR